MSVPLTAAQARTLAELVVLNDGLDLTIDGLGNPGEAGPLFVSLADRMALVIDEAGICSLAEPEVVSARV